MKELESAQALESEVVEYPPVELPVASKIDPWWAFVRSTRFWVMILGATSVYLETKGWIGEPERNFIATISTVFITVKTLDRGAEKMASK